MFVKHAFNNKLFIFRIISNYNVLKKKLNYLFIFSIYDFMYFQYGNITSLFLFKMCVTRYFTNKKISEKYIIFLKSDINITSYFIIKRKTDQCNKIIFNDFK